MPMFTEKPKLVRVTKWRLKWEGKKLAKSKRFREIVEARTVE